VGKNVAVFVDVANIFYAAKAAGVDIDYVTLLKAASAGRDLVRAYAYTGLDPENENQRNFHSFLARNGYKVVSKDIRKYGDGKVKANLDIELVVDMMKTARNLDIAIVVSGDGDFAPAIRAVQEMGVRCEVISFRGNTSSDLIDVADQFTEITALAKVEKGSSRSGRRVAGDEEDLSMTEVPDKQTEGAGGRVRGRGRGRGRAAEPERVLEPAAVTSSGAPLVVLPGERLSRAEPSADEGEAVSGEAASAEAIETFDGRSTDDAESDGRRRRRRRGGRGRGRGRAREELAPESAAGPAEEDEFVEAPRTPRHSTFGSVWDTQLGVPSAAPRSSGPPTEPEDEDFDEPEIPEYLIAEQRRNRGGGAGARGGRQQGGRGARGAYAAAIERERYGRGGGSGINRYPDVSGRERPRDAGFSRQERGGRPDRGPRPERQGERRGGGGEPWSEVPPELEAMLRAQISSRPRSAETGAESQREPVQETSAELTPFDAVSAPEAAALLPARGRGRRTSAAAGSAGSAGESTGDGGESAAAAPARRRTTRKTASVAADVAGEDKPKRRTTRRSSTAGAATSEPSTGDASSPDAEPTAAPKRRTTRRSSAAGAATADGEAPKRRTTRRKATDPEPKETPAE
jgi:uncharacterized LabA/DUF88 family protein